MIDYQKTLKFTGSKLTADYKYARTTAIRLLIAELGLEAANKFAFGLKPYVLTSA